MSMELRDRGLPPRQPGLLSVGSIDPRCGASRMDWQARSISFSKSAFSTVIELSPDSGSLPARRHDLNEILWCVPRQLAL